MRKLFLSLLTVFILVIFNGCASSGYKDFYNPYYKGSLIDFKGKYPFLEFLKEGEEPKIFVSNNLKEDIQNLKSKRYSLIGYSSFNGGLENEKAVKEQAKAIGAKIALYSWEYTNTQTNSGTLVLPHTNYQTTNIYGNVGGTMYSGTAYSQSFDTQTIPYSYSQRRYDQVAFFFVKNNNDYNFGTAESTEISREKRIEIGTNGVEVNVIIEGTPAFNSDLLIGDIIIGINNESIKDYNHLLELEDNCYNNKGNCIVKVYRNGQIKDLIVNFEQ